MSDHSRDNTDAVWTKSTDGERQESDVVRENERLHAMIALADAPEEMDTEVGESVEKASAYEPDFADRAEEALRRLYKKLPSAGKSAVKAVRRGMYQLGDVLYEVGFYTEYTMVKFGRALKKVMAFLAGWLLKALLLLIKTVLWLPAAVITLLVKPFWHLFHAGKGIHEIWFNRDPDKPGEMWKNIFRYLGGGIRKHTHLITDILGWILPIAAGAMFVFTVRTVMDFQYVLQLSYDDQVLGYVENENVFETAQQDVRRRIVYTEEDTGDQWSLQPTYMLAVNDGVKLLNAGQVADAILQSSGEEIVEATGFYLEGKFYGAVTDGERLQQELEEIKAPYATGEEGEYISFVVEPQLVEGVYLRSSVVDYATIGDLIHSQVAGEVRYTVQNGDVPSVIANKHGLTTNELVNLNPQQDILKSLHPGDSLLVSQAVPFLRVQVTYRRTELEEVPYETVRTTTADLNYGFTKVKTKGVKGINECEYDYVYVDGVLQSKTKVSTRVISAPVAEEILVGTTVKPGVTLVPSSTAYMWPVPAYTYCSRGFTGLYAHNGIDICGPYGTPIYATQSGVVTKAVYTGRGYGVYVIIDHGGGYSSLYGHCSSLTVQAGQVVNQGDLIAYMGSTGNSTGNHCHFEIRINNIQVNPATYVGYW